MSVRSVLIWTDAQGEETVHMVVTNAGLGGLVAALNGVSNAFIREESSGTRTSHAGSGVVATYPTVRSTANLQYRDSTTGSMDRIYVPAPVSGIFLGDGVTVNPAAIATLNAAVIGSVLAGSLNPVDQFIGGQLEATRVGLLNSAPLF